IEVCTSMGRVLGRPWATFATDAYSRRLLGCYLTFDPPSYRSCMMVLRACVRRHQRFPQSIVVDGGPEFQSTYFESLVARYNGTKKNASRLCGFLRMIRPVLRHSRPTRSTTLCSKTLI